VGVLVVLTVGLVFWIVAWAFGAKAFDAFLVTMLLVVSAAAVRAVSPVVKQLLGRESAPPAERGAGF
jgi:Mn2+/Fe2+ NRAMP family transporter